MDYNSTLFEIYKEHWPALQTALKNIDTKERNISYPLLIRVPPEYERTKTKVFVIGQETYGWGFHNAEYWGTAKWHNSIDELINRLMDVYSGFNLGKKYYSTPFWYTAHNLFNKLNPSGPHYGFLWSNLIKVDQNKGCPEDHIEVTVRNSFPVLPLEIKTTSPDVVVFFTGPYYDYIIKRLFNDVILIGIEGFETRQFAQIIQSDLPQYTFRTYHPRYGIGAKNVNYRLILETIVKRVRETS